MNILDITLIFGIVINILFLIGTMLKKKDDTTESLFENIVSSPDDEDDDDDASECKKELKKVNDEIEKLKKKSKENCIEKLKIRKDVLKRKKEKLNIV